MWPRLNGGRFADSKDPEFGFGNGKTSGPAKQSRIIAMRTAPGNHSSSLRRRTLRRSLRSGANSLHAASIGSSTSLTSFAAIADPRIEHGIQQVGKEVGN